MQKKNVFRWIYEIIPEKCYNADLGEYYTYGIKVKGQKVSMVLHDISVDEGFVSELSGLLNQYQLCPIHLTDVFEDLLFDISSH